MEKKERMWQGKKYESEEEGETKADKDKQGRESEKRSVEDRNRRRSEQDKREKAVAGKRGPDDATVLDRGQMKIC